MICVFVAACCATTVAAEEPLPLSFGQRSLVERAVRASLKDPSSATFKDIIAARFMVENSWPVRFDLKVCGRVNARNSFGGYNGFARFYGVLVEYGGEQTFRVEEIDRSGSKKATAQCKRAGL